MTQNNPACPGSSGFYHNPRLPAHHSYQVVALVMQGGGALGAYQCGVYQGLVEADLHPNWVAGISIGALNVAMIAGNPPEQGRAFANILGNHLPPSFFTTQPIQPYKQQCLACCPGRNNI